LFLGGVLTIGRDSELIGILTESVESAGEMDFGISSSSLGGDLLGGS
jgi:hypothetical protein